ncbi:MAG: DUF6494 family protein [Pseudomonadota bacterium]
MSTEFNMSMRKFLKQVGVTSQQAIEDALRAADSDGKSYTIKAVITCEELELHHEVDGTLKEQD